MQEGHSWREDVWTKAEIREEKRCYVIGFEGREKGAWTVDEDSPLKLKQTRKWILPQSQ